MRLRLPRTAIGILSLVLVTLTIGTAIVAPFIVGDAANETDTSAILQGSSPEHWFGTDNLGRDILARLLVATRLSLVLALGSTAIAAVLGILIGALPSVLGTRLGRLVTTGIDIAIAFPSLLVVLFLAVIFGVGSQAAMFAIGLAMVPFFARLTQTLTASIASKDYIAAARLMGLRRSRILVRYVLPNIAEPLIVDVAITVGQALLTFAGLSFLGLGVQSPEYDWGLMLQNGLARIYVTPAAALAPGVAVIIAGIAFNMAGDALAAAAGTRARTPRTRKAKQPWAHTVSDTTSGLLVARNLRVSFPVEGAGWAEVVRGIDLTIQPGEIVGLVGESGSGKSLTGAAIVRTLPYPGHVTADRLEFDGVDLLGRESPALARTLGGSVSMIFQDPMNALNPALSVGRQVTEAPETHRGLSRQRGRLLGTALLRALRVSDPERRIRQFPHEFSGGMRQRSVIAMGLAVAPRLMIADEPTTALDVTVQQQTLQVLKQAQHDTGTAVLFISHDLAVVSQICDRVLVMYAGRIVEELPADRLTQAAHPYTRALIASSPDIQSVRTAALATIPGRPPALGEETAGCPFAERCAFATRECVTEAPPLVDRGDRQELFCFHPQAEPVERGSAA